MGAGLVVLALCACRAPDGRRAALQESEQERARAATAREDWTAAARHWNRVFMRFDESSSEACLETARALLELGDTQSAKGVLDLGLRHHPQDPGLLEMHGNVLARLGFRRAAESEYMQALAVDPERQSALLELGRVRLELGMHAGALTALEQCIALGGSDPETFCLAGRAWRDCGRFEEAYEAFSRSFESEEVPAAELVGAARMYTSPAVRGVLARGRELSRAWLERAVALDPQDTRAHWLLGVICEDSGDLAAAENAYLRSVETDPGCLQSLESLARFQVRQGQREAARETALRALELEPDAATRAELEAIVRAVEDPENEPR